jgi:hypothetical protein
MDVPCERVPCILIALTTVAFPVGPAGIVVALLLVLTRSLPIVASTEAEQPRVIAISAATARSGLAPVVVTIAVVRAAAACAAGFVRVPLVVARVVVPRVKFIDVLPFLLWIPDSSWQKHFDSPMESEPRLPAS